jgi:hypothetical protein
VSFILTLGQSGVVTQTLELEVQVTSSLFVLGLFPKIVINFTNVNPNLRA